MRLINTTKNVVLHEDVKRAKTIDEKMRGLIDALETDAMLFDTRWGIHTFGMKFPIDCVICDDEWKIRNVRHSMTPNTMMFWNPKHKNVLELPAGTLRHTQTEIGDQVFCGE